MSNETILFKWTREDGKYVIIENGKLLARNADDMVINPETDEAADLFIEAFMVMSTELAIATLNDDEHEDFRIRETIDKQIRYMMSPCHNIGLKYRFMADCMFNGPMEMFGCYCKSSHLNCDNKDSISDKEYFYKRRKAMMENFREARQEEYDHIAKEKQRIIDTAIPYEALAVCPADLITESDREYQKQHGYTVVTVGHDIENRQLYNIIAEDDKFVLPEHQLEINRITDDCFRIADKNDVYSYYDIRKKQALFSAPERIFIDIDNVLYYKTDNNTTVCYDYDGNRLAEFTSDWKLYAMIGGRPLVSRRVTEEEQKMLERINYKYKHEMYNIISEDGNLMFNQWQFDIYVIKYPNRFTTIAQDGICSIYSTEDFSQIYTSERPRCIKRNNYYSDNSNKDLFIFTQTVGFDEIEPGIIVNVESGEVISKDESGNPKDFEKIEYPNPYNGKHWRAQLSTKIERMESIDPLTGKRIRNSKKQ